MNKLSNTSRIIIAIASLSLIATYFLPVWFIFLQAPQYPEGLTMQIWLYKLSGQVDIINGLNHYIGMKHIKVEMFPEFKYLVYIVGFFIAFGLFVAISGKRKLLFGLIMLTVVGAIAAMIDFYIWGYDYGHNLDPNAAIQIPGFSYQPPLVGHKTLLNFDAYSYPDNGGWVVIIASVIFFLVWLYEFWRSRKAAYKPALSGLAIMTVMLLGSCSSGPEPIVIGKDICDDCKMTIMDPKFGGEIITKKGKIYKFDDAHCIGKFLGKKVVEEDNIRQIAFVSYEDGIFIDSKSAAFVVSPELKSPMNSHAACFPSIQAADPTLKRTSGTLKTWEELVKSL